MVRAAVGISERRACGLLMVGRSTCRYEAVTREANEELRRKLRDLAMGRRPVTLLRSMSVDVKVQQELLRHANVTTTLNIYTQAIPDDVRTANSRAVGMLLVATG
jgi:integrase